MKGERHTLRIGELSAEWEDGGLRYIRYGEEEMVRGIYAAVRDPAWGTVPGSISEVRFAEKKDGFTITFVSIHRNEEILFTWRGSIEAKADGMLRFSFEGMAGREFWSNRIGICVLLPPELADREVIAQTREGTVRTRFPVHISAHQPLPPLTVLEFHSSVGVPVQLAFTGDLFEMEDQRNWTDASYKLYCTPLERPYPVLVKPSCQIIQSVTLTWADLPDRTVHKGKTGLTCHTATTASPGDEAVAGAVNVQSSVITAESRPMPAIGLVWSEAASSSLQSPEMIELLRQLRLSHLRVCIPLDSPNWRPLLSGAFEMAQILNCELELEATGELSRCEQAEVTNHAEIRQEPEPAWVQLLNEIRKAADHRIARLLVFPSPYEATNGELLKQVKREAASFGLDFPVGGGTRAYFAEFNRADLPVGEMDFAAYSINPQVHAFDDRSLMETIPMQKVTLQNAKRIFGRSEVTVGPVTFKPRFIPNSSDGRQISYSGRIDVRQHGLFGAAWTLASVAALCAGGPLSLTYYETAGPLGVIRNDQQGVYPLYHVLADLNEWKDACFFPLEFDFGYAIGMGLKRKGGFSLLLAGLHPGEVTARVRLGSGIREAKLRLLDETSLNPAENRPLNYRETFAPLAVEADEEGNAVISIKLSNYGYACVQVNESNG